jgi:hypothetical protein
MNEKDVQEKLEDGITSHEVVENMAFGIAAYIDNQGKFKVKTLGNPHIVEILGLVKCLELEMDRLWGGAPSPEKK